MVEKEKKMVLYASEEAAQYRDGISGWVSREGRFFGEDEHLARYDGCTHVPCKDCGDPVSKSSYRTICRACGARAADRRYDGMPRKPWDGTTPVAEFDSDRFFFSHDEFEDYCECEGIDPGDVRLVHCESVIAGEIDDDHWADSLPEDTTLEDVAPELASAVAALNFLIRERGFILSWVATNVAVDLSEEG